MTPFISSLSFTVKRHEPELVAPAKPTPREVKQLSDIDDQEGLRFHIPFIFFYKNIPSMEGQDPIRATKEALARALVYYYPLAGRLREGFNRKLSVDCTGNGGVLFTGATANVRLEQLGEAIRPPCPFLDEFLYNVPESDGILDCPLMLIQVTRLLCGGFVLALRFNHAITDGFGLAQFLNTLAEMARGKSVPSILPVWQRELLNAREPPRITCQHREYEETFFDAPTNSGLNSNDVIQRSFFFTSNFIRSVRKQLPERLANCSQFELLTACLWKCRTVALKHDPDELVSVSRAVGARANLFSNFPLGFYGNAVAFPAAVSKSELLCKKPIGYAVELVKSAKAEMTEEYIRSVADLMVTRGRPMYKTAANFVVSDTRLAGLEKVDLGWGLPVYAGPAATLPGMILYAKYKNGKGQEGIVAPVWLPRLAMQRFELELKKIILLEPYCSIKFTTKAVNQIMASNL